MFFWGFERAKRSDEVSIVPHLLAFWFFFSRDIPSAFVLIEGYFLRAYFSATIQTFQKETQLDVLSNRVKNFPKIFHRCDFISFESAKFSKIFRVFVDFCYFSFRKPQRIGPM